MARHAVFGVQHPTHLQSRNRVLVYGDSLTAGYPDFTPYAKRMSAVCADAGVGTEVVGCGLCGLTSQDMVQHLRSRGLNDAAGRTGVGLQKLLEDESLDEGPFSLVLIMVGTNDLFEGREAGQIVSDIQRLHAACAERATRTVVLGVPDFRRGQAPHEEAHLIQQQANNMLREWVETSIATAQSKNDSQDHHIGVPVLFIDSAKLLPYDGSDAWESDGVHFSELGSARFGEAVAPYIARLLATS